MPKTSTRELVQQYNQLAAEAGKPQIKSWKQSQDKLTAKIQQLRPAARPSTRVSLKKITVWTKIKNASLHDKIGRQATAILQAMPGGAELSVTDIVSNINTTKTMKTTQSIDLVVRYYLPKLAADGFITRENKDA